MTDAHDIHVERGLNGCRRSPLAENAMAQTVCERVGPAARRDVALTAAGEKADR